MKLYQYHHCPYCLRARMTANYRKIPIEYVNLLNDDESTCFELINAKMVPILQFDDGTAMGESLDIVAKLKELGDPAQIMRDAAYAEQINHFLDTIRQAYNRLYFPRNLLVDMPEFATRSARDYFQHKKEKQMGISFAEALEDSPALITQVSKAFGQLPFLPLNEHLGMDDILLYPFLRNLSLVKDLHFPAQIKQYIEHIAALTDTETFFAQAV